MPKQEEAKQEKNTTGATDVEGSEACRTNALVDSFSVCLMKNRFCPHALAFGHQFLCRHPRHAEFIVPAAKKK